MSSPLKPGYKQTEVGIIPDDWEVRPLSQITDPKRPIGYGIVQTGRRVANGVRCVRVVDIEDGRVNGDDLITTSFEISRSYKRTLLAEGDLVIALRGKIGALAVIDKDLIGANLTRGVALLAPSVGFDSNYLCHYLSSPNARQVFEKNLNGSALQEIPIATLRKIPAIVPPLPDQRAIAAALGDVDALLSTLTELITKKRGLKQAAMQQLLTGHQRLPGFTGTWEVKRLGDVVEVVSGGTPKTGVPAYWDGEIKWCTPTDITGTAGKYLFDTARTISSLGLASCSARLLPAGALLLCSRATIGEVKIAADTICTNQGFKSLVCGEYVSNEFIYYLLLTMKRQMVEKAIGSTFLEISKKDAVLLDISLPPSPEQAAIAAVLSDMDAELAALEQRLAKTRDLKQGMMQELLTGRTRLV